MGRAKGKQAGCAAGMRGMRGRGCCAGGAVRAGRCGRGCAGGASAHLAAQCVDLPLEIADDGLELEAALRRGAPLLLEQLLAGLLHHLELLLPAAAQLVPLGERGVVLQPLEGRHQPRLAQPRRGAGQQPVLPRELEPLIVPRGPAPDEPLVHDAPRRLLVQVVDALGGLLLLFEGEPLLGGAHHLDTLR